MFDLNKERLASFFVDFTEDEVNEFFVRLSGYIRKSVQKEEKITKNRVMRGAYIILEDIHKVKDAAMKKKIDYTGVRNVCILKYGDEIIALQKEGKGARAISTLMKSRHNAKASKNTIQKFLDTQIFWTHGKTIEALQAKGLSSEKISKVLKEEYNIQISKRSVENYLLKNIERKRKWQI